MSRNTAACDVKHTNHQIVQRSLNVLLELVSDIKIDVVCLIHTVTVTFFDVDQTVCVEAFVCFTGS